MLAEYWPFDWVLGRHACLGFDVLQELHCRLANINFQKSRIDLFRSQNLFKFQKINLLSVRNILLRKDILHLVAQQKWTLSVPSHPPKFILIDSFSELTDQLYQNKKEGWEFFCNQEDLLLTKDLKDAFISKGLLSNNLMHDYYRYFFEYLHKRYPDVPIIFLHIPKKLENRRVYIERNDIIRRVIKDIASVDRLLLPISINEDVVDWKRDSLGRIDYFPYHYNQETYIEYAKIISKLSLI